MENERIFLEHLVIGSILIENSHLELVRKYLQVTDFLDWTAWQIFKAMLEYKGNFTIFNLPIKPQEKKQGLLWIGQALKYCPSINFVLWVNRLLEISTSEKMTEAIHKKRPDEALRVAREMPEIEQEQARLTLTSKEATRNFLSDLEARRTSDIEKYETHLPKLKKSAVLLPGRLWVIAGVSKSGKTTFLLNLIAHYLQKGLKVLLVSLEQGPNEIIAKLLQPPTRIEGWKIDAPKNLAQEDYVSLMEAARNLAEKPLSISEAKGFKEIIETVQNADIDILFLDYIQIIRRETESLPMEIKDWMAGLKNVAKEKNIPVIVVSQLGRQGVAPQWSSAIEQNADMIMTITGSEKDKDGVYLTVKWNRQGPAPVKIKLHTNLAISLIAEEREGEKWRHSRLSGSVIADKN